jgi:hypothetical protein
MKRISYLQVSGGEDGDAGNRADALAAIHYRLAAQ